MKRVMDMVAEANALVETITVEEAKALHGAEGVTFVDIRDVRELKRDGAVPDAFHCPRGMLEFWIDPDGPYPKPEFQRGGRYVFFCAGGLRSALAARTAQEMGLEGVCHIEGGFGAWKKSGGPVEER